MAAALEVSADGDPNWQVSDWQLEENRLVSALASRIAGRTLEPAWLRQGLKDAAGAICFALRDEAKHPNRKPLRSRLLETQAAIELLTSGLTDKAIRSALEGPDQAGFDAIASAWRALRDMRPLVAPLSQPYRTARESKSITQAP
jgi:hypothetical protein